VAVRTTDGVDVLSLFARCCLAVRFGVLLEALPQLRMGLESDTMAQHVADR